jgi:hypothetical protein
MVKYYGIVAEDQSHVTTIEHLHEIMYLLTDTSFQEVITLPALLFMQPNLNYVTLETNEIVFGQKYNLLESQTYKMFNIGNQLVLDSIINFAISKSCYGLAVEILQQCLNLHSCINISDKMLQGLLITSLLKEK